MAATATPGVSVQLTTAPPAPDPVAVDVAAFVGVFERGPLDTPVRVTSWPEVGAAFGDFVANGIGAYALKAWVDNGGRVAYVVRVAAPARETVGSGTQPTDRHRSRLADPAGFVVGAVAAVRTPGATWLHLVTATGPAPGEVTWDRPLDPAVDLTAAGTVVQTGAFAAEAQLPGDDGVTPVLGVAATSPGAWGNALAVGVARETGAATTSRAVPAPAAAATAVASVDGFAVGDGVRVSQDALAERRVLAAIDRDGLVLTWDAPLTVVDPTQPLRVETETFALSVRRAGLLAEVFRGLALHPAHPRYAPAVLEASALVRATALDTALPAPAGPVALQAGRDGTAALSVDDLLGDEALVTAGGAAARGLATLALVDEPALVALPDLVAEPVPARLPPPPQPAPDPCDPCPPPPAPPDLARADVREAGASFDAAAIATAQRALVDHCERRADRVALLDPPSAAGPLPVAALAAWSARYPSSYAVAAAPWVTVLDPLEARARLRRLPPSGHLAGLFARVDAEEGPWLAPANRVLAWAHGLDAAVDDAGHGVLNDAGVQVLRAQPGRGPVLLGARTLSADGAWRFVGVRRLFLLLERTLRTGLAWTAFEPAGPGLDRAMALTITGLLEALAERGAFATPQDAFFVHTGGGDRLAGEVLVDVGVAAAGAIEHLLLQVVRTADRLELRELPDRSA